MVGSLPCAPRRPFGLGASASPNHGHAVDHLEPGDSVLIYTDGVVDAHRSSGTPFGLERLIDVINQALQVGLTPAETLRHVGNELVDGTGDGDGLLDDASTLLLTWHPAPPGPQYAADR